MTDVRPRTRMATSAPASPEAAPPRRRRRWRPSLTALAIAAPAIVVFLYFSWGPIVSSLAMSVQRVVIGGESSFVGWENFAYVLSDPGLPQATLNTIYYTVLAVLFGFPVPLALAVFISEMRSRSWYFSALAYLPVMVPPVVAILLWKFFYAPDADGTPGAGSGSVSAAASAFAKQGSAEQADPAYVASLPASQKCG